MSSMVSLGKKKKIIGYKDDDCKMKPLHIMLQQIIAYAKKYDG